MRVGLVLGAGAVQGAVWMEGALAALADETGWFPGDAEIVVGTSAGSWMGLLLSAGVPPWLLAAQSEGVEIEGLLPGIQYDAPDGPSVLRQLLGLRPGSPELAVRSVAGLSARQWWMGMMPRGVRDSGIEELARRVVPSGWPDGAELWCVVLDYRTGRRVVLGRDPETPPDAACAVAASCAIPFVYRPQTIGGRQYIDGGFHSVSNLDLLAHAGLDLVICLNPASSLDGIAPHEPRDLAWGAIRSTVGRALGREVRRVRASGTPVLLLQPRTNDLEVLGNRWLRPHRVPEVIAEAGRTVRAQLAESDLGDLLARLPDGAEHLVRRPAGEPAGWPPLIRPPAYLPAS